jgi:hypothetical protein
VLNRLEPDLSAPFHVQVFLSVSKRNQLSKARRPRAKATGLKTVYSTYAEGSGLAFFDVLAAVAFGLRCVRTPVAFVLVDVERVAVVFVLAALLIRFLEGLAAARAAINSTA